MKRIDENRIAIQDRSRPERGRFAEVRVSRDEVRIGEIVNIRVWYVPKGKDPNEWFPTRQGIAIPIEHVVDLVAALARLFPEAIEQFLDNEYDTDGEDAIDEWERTNAPAAQRLEDVMSGGKSAA